MVKVRNLLLLVVKRRGVRHWWRHWIARLRIPVVLLAVSVVLLAVSVLVVLLLKVAVGCLRMRNKTLLLR